MIFTDDDIDFTKIDWIQFEELCYDLLVKYHFHSMAWRQGGADNGRDIEAKRYITDSIVSPYQEQWFVECKRYSNGLPLEQIVEKVNWARVEKADHFLLIVSSYITTATREWLDKAKKTEAFKIHVIEGKFLKQQLLLFPNIIVKYFADDNVRLVRSLLMHWVTHHILPTPKALFDLYQNLDFSKLNHQELGFMWHSYVKSEEELERYCDDNNLTPISWDGIVPFDFIIPFLKAAQNWDYPVMKQDEKEKFGFINGLGQASMEPQNSDFSYSNIHYELPNRERVQVCLVKENKILEVRIGVGFKPI
ncbi:restriction endonuclease [Mucilaginibacter gilvus]|uniref:Restriction endonuclease n=1 Tax=Mucilaginibacter gilvus TaxID=2305909 RepID=A0A444MJ62_9SPHI|nr:restriction endonuclease [Mucilaginibacter gilvus]RWY48175.1 restriction endonuclease [Mucilaginibacter gilvus]